MPLKLYLSKSPSKMTHHQAVAFYADNLDDARVMGTAYWGTPAEAKATTIDRLVDNWGAERGQLESARASAAVGDPRRFVVLDDDD